MNKPKDWEKEVKSIAQYLNCNEGELWSEISKIIRQVEQKAREEERERVLGIVGGMKTDERKVAVFGSRMDSWEARTYDEKMLVNAALSDLTTKLKEHYKNN